MAAMYGKKVHGVLKNPTGRQKIAPMPMAVAATSGCFWPWSRGKGMEPSMGAAMSRPIAQQIDVHAKGENFEPLAGIERYVNLWYLQYLTTMIILKFC
jgi:hypothetical protein